MQLIYSYLYHIFIPMVPFLLSHKIVPHNCIDEAQALRMDASTATAGDPGSPLSLYVFSAQ
jgi:hypothetical protein